MDGPEPAPMAVRERSAAAVPKRACLSTPQSPVLAATAGENSLGSLLPLRKIRGKSGWPGYLASHRFVKRDVIGFKRGAQGLVERDLGVRVVRHGLHLRANGTGQVALILNHLKHGTRTELVFALIGGQRLLLQV